MTIVNDMSPNNADNFEDTYGTFLSYALCFPNILLVWELISVWMKVQNSLIRILLIFAKISTRQRLMKDDSQR